MKEGAYSIGLGGWYIERGGEREGEREGGRAYSDKL